MAKPWNQPDSTPSAMPSLKDTWRVLLICEHQVLRNSSVQTPWTGQTLCPLYVQLEGQTSPHYDSLWAACRSLESPLSSLIDTMRITQNDKDRNLSKAKQHKQLCFNGTSPFAWKQRTGKHEEESWNKEKTWHWPSAVPLLENLAFWAPKKAIRTAPWGHHPFQHSKRLQQFFVYSSVEGSQGCS